jgi:DNA-binding MarR family transcriptional regulator
VNHPQDLEPERDALLDALAQTAYVTIAALSKIGADSDLSLTQVRVLAILRDRRLRMSALADFLGLEKSTMSGLVDRAEERGLLFRAPNAEDGRAVDVFLSAKGAALADRGYAGFRESMARMTSELNQAEQRRLQALLERMLTYPAA